MNRLSKFFLTAIAGLFFVGCYNDFDNPGPAKIYTDADFSSFEYLSIKDIKDMFYAQYPGNSGIGQNLTFTQKAYTRGKVISNDRMGNIYKSLYIYDEETESAIELRLNTDNYLFHPVGQIVYVELKGLVLGNYRTMLSIGTVSGNPDYANGNIVSAVMLEKHIKSGAQMKLTTADTLVVTKDNFKERLSDNVLGRLVRFEGLESKFGLAQWGYKNQFPNYFANQTSYDVNSPDTPGIPEDLQWSKIYDWATWAAQRDMPDGSSFKTTFFFGSAWFTYGDLSAGDIVPGNYVIRSSGYSRFKTNKIPADGTIVNVTALYTKFSNSSGADFSVAYQLLLNTDTDVVKVQ